MSMKGVSSFEVTVYHDGKQYVFYGDEVRRDTTDGAGNQVLYARCYRIVDPVKHTFDMRGVVNLNPDWTVKSIMLNGPYVD